MKLRKTILGIMLMVIICTTIFGQMVSNAEESSSSITVKRRQYNQNGWSYLIASGSTGIKNKVIWYLYDVNDAKKTLYCIKAGYGSEWNKEENSFNPVTYDLPFDMETNKVELLSALGNADSDNSIKENYNSIVWVLENAYVPNGYATQDEKDTAKLALLEKAGIVYGEIKTYDGSGNIISNYGYYYDIEGNEYCSYKTAFFLKDADEEFIYENNNKISVVLSDDDIEAVQQAVLWYFTNNTDTDTVYNKLETPGWLYYRTGTPELEKDENFDRGINTSTDYNSNYYSSISDMRNERTEYENSNYGDLINTQVNILYRYLITEAEKIEEPSNDETDVYIENLKKAPITIGDGANEQKLNVTTLENHYVFGPMQITKNNETTYNLDLEVYSGETKITDYYFSDIDGNKLDNSETINDMVGNQGFYITISKDKINNKNIQFKLGYSYEKTKKTVWLENTKAEQPLVEVSKEPDGENITLTAQVKEFDLALRKIIVGLSRPIVNEENEPATRTFFADPSTIQDEKTATYQHRKDPVVVKTNDIVTYSIRIYNEGEQDGYAKKIVDQLPKGLQVIDGTNLIESSKGNKYEIDATGLMNPKNSATYPVILTMVEFNKDLDAFNGTNLDFEEIELKCVVTEKASDTNNKILTNIAYIAEEINSETGETITDKRGIDRDSTPGDNPVTNSTNLDLVTSDIGYTGIESHNEDALKNNGNYYKGEQDDDDFEKVVLLPTEKIIISGEKIWEDNNNEDQVRPDSVQVGLYIENQDKTLTFVEKKVVTSADNWRYSFTLEKYDEDENEIKYVVKELDENNEPRENGEIFSVEKDGEDEEDKKRVKYEVSYDENSYDITNKYLPFDLALFKYIAAISEDAIIEEGEYVTDTGNKDGTYSRAPVATGIDENGEINYGTLDKTPLLVESGDYVLYRIRVYNEGQIDGYASLIKDSLPEGLDFVNAGPEETELTETEREYVKEVNGNWEINAYNIYSQRVEEIVTNNLAKEQGAEYGAQEGDNNYKANLLRAFDTNAQINNDNPDWREVEVLCKVTEPNSSKSILVNIAEIAEDTDENGKDITDTDSTPNNDKDGEDDIDIEKIKLQCFDLALRKYISSINGIQLNEEASRIPVVDISNLYQEDENGEVITTATYKHSKTPVTVALGDTVVYTLRIYNEGDVAGYASEITDHLPDYLEFVKDSDINEEYGWVMYDEEGNTTEDVTKAVKVKTTYLSTHEIEAFKGNSTELDYEEVQIECKIKENAKVHENITNIAEISEYKYNDNIVNKDVDSKSDSLTDGDTETDFLPEDKDLPTYKDDEKGEYVEGQEDDDDFEKVYVKEFDLALKKFITAVEEENVTSRIPQVSYEDEKITYTHSKDALEVVVGNVIEYTIRVYNEGEVAGYASEVTDDIPEYLEYLPENDTNKEYGWIMYDKDGKVTEKVEEAVKIKTTYLSKEAGELKLEENSEEVNPNLLNAFDGTKEISDTNPSYKDVIVAFKVKDPGSSEDIIINHAQISDDEDENGNDVIDKDSTPDDWKDGEDDQDVENIKVQYFDLALLKYVSKVIIVEDGKETITETGYNGYENPEPVVKVELDRKKLSKITVKYVYSIKITNEGDIAGYATEITDYVPEGLKFYAEDNQNWTDEGNNVISTKALKDTLLQPGESATVQVTLRWINDKNNLGLKINTAEISEDNNDKDVPDKDSTPDNKKDGEDDIDTAEVILAIKTGKGTNYIMLVLAVFTTLGGGIALIKKFVL